MPRTKVKIDGDGVSSLCCAHLLARSSIPYFIESQPTRKQPAVLIGTQTASLLKDVCQAEDLLHAGWKIERRVVQWGGAKEAVSVRHDAIAIPEESLIKGMTMSLDPLKKGHRDTNWKIITRNRGDDSAFTAYGQRCAASQRVTLKQAEDSRSCWSESTRYGWLFLLPFSANEASLIVAAYEPSKVVEESRLIMPRLASEVSLTRASSIAPRIARSLCGDGMILAGSAAMRFDPLCGEGVGHAAREAYLAVAVIRAMLRGESTDDLFRHYSSRLRKAFLRHLTICSSFYRSGGSSDFWRTEEELQAKGIGELMSQPESYSPLQFRFSGLDLEVAAPHPALRLSEEESV